MIETILSAARMGFPVELLLKATLVLAVAGAATLAMGRASAATRHLVWAIGVAALLILPLLALIGPRWEVAVERASAASTTEGAFMTPGSGTAPAAGPASASGSSSNEVSRAPTAAPSAGDEVSPAASAPAGSTNGRIESVVRSLGWAPIALAVWAAGALLLLLRIAFGWWGTRRLSRAAEPVVDAEWLQLLKDATWQLDVDRDVALLRGASASTPMTWGTRRPAILIPAGADEWPEERRRVVLLHEMAHVARRDCLTQTLAEVTCALYWFHPLVWVASRRLRSERERACDDRVLAAGEGAADYAAHLLEVARTYRGRQPHHAGAIGMARPSQLEGRLLAVLDGAKKRGAPGRREILVAAAIAALVLVPLAAVRAVDAQSRADAAEDPTLLQQLRATIGEATPDLRQGSAAAKLAGSANLNAALADSTVDLSVAARPGGTVTIDVNDGGDLTIVGWPNDFVELHAELSGRSASEMRVELTERNGTVTLFSEHTGSRRNRDGRHAFELRVPASSDLRIENDGGNLTIEDVSGSFSGGTGGGEITLARLTGRANLRTGGGEIRVSDSRLDGSVHTGGGEVSVINNIGDLRGTTGGGTVRFAGAGPTSTGQAGEPTRIHTGGGDIELVDLPGGADLSTGGGDITLRSAGGPLVARTGGGDIHVERASSSVTAETGAGDIMAGAVGGSAIARTGSGDISVGLTSASAGRDVDLRTGSGDVVLNLPADFGGSFEVVIEGRRPRAQQIRSDIPLTTEVTEINGRPALRATGSVGTGRSRVTLHTSSGDVTIRHAGAGSTAAAIYTLPAGRGGNDAAADDLGDSLDSAFSEAFGEEFGRNIETLVSNSVGTLASGLARFTADVTVSALEDAVAALERAEREGRITVRQQGDLDELREELVDVRKELEIDVRNEIRNDIANDVETDIRQDIRSDAETEIRNDVQQDIRTDSR